MVPIATSSQDTEPYHDYTEGASALDIDQALDNRRRSRRDSQYSTYFDTDGDGAVFSGPGHVANPSSVSRMSHMELGRRSSDAWLTRRKSIESRPSHRKRRDSKSSQVSRQSVEGAERPPPDDDDLSLHSDDDDIASTGRRRRQRRSPSPPSRAGVFNNLAHLFGRTGTSEDRRPSVSQRSSTSRISRRSRSRDAVSENAVDTDDNEEERWGYSSGEEYSDSESGQSADVIHDNASITASMQYDSEPSSPLEASQNLPLLNIDPVFGGEARIDMDTTFTLLEPPPPGPPSRQTIYIADEDSTVRFVGYETITLRVWLWRTCCVLTCGILGLLGHWFPYLWLRCVAREKAFKDAHNGFLVVESAYKAIVLIPIQLLEYPYRISTVFLESVPTIPGTSSLVLDEQYNDPNAILKHLLIVDYRHTRFAIDPRTGLFEMVRDWRDPSWSNVQAAHRGIDQETKEQRKIVFGKNEIDIEGKSTVSLLVDEVIHPFYVFQIASIILWSLDDYYYYAFCIGLISVISITTTLIETKKTVARMREMSKLICTMDVLKNGFWTETDSSELVPGDIVNLSTSHLSLIPADFFLLSGDAIVNESMLTGESVPVSKTPVRDEDIIRWRDEKTENAKTFLYCGTKVVRIRGTFTNEGQGRPALAVVARTGFNTTKGALIRSMLFPKPIGFKFYRDSVRFIGVLAGIAGLGFCFSAIEFVRIGLPWQTILVRALDLITVVVPPALPATLSIGTSFAVGRLRKLGIYCISPSRVNVAGKINVCCFDKTGTLTEDGLDILGVRSLDKNEERLFGELCEDVHDLPLGKEKATFLHALATCHSLKMVDGEVIGDPLDVKMFGFTKWTLEEGRVAGTGNIKAKGTVVDQAALVQTVVRPPGSAQFRLEDALKGSARHAHFLELGVIRAFDFVSSLRRMSVIVKRLKSSSMEIYVKGAPEVMADICDKSSFPTDYDDLLSYYTKRGYRVIAIAGKSIEGLSWLKAQRMKREQAESGLKFLGLVIFENRLKPGTAPAIQALRSAHLACRMITGDNPLTAVSVARECSLINQAAHVFAPIFSRGNASIPASKLVWSSMDDPLWKLDSYSLKPMPPPPHLAVEGDEINYQDYSLVITGDVFRWMLNYAPLETTTELIDILAATYEQMLVKTQIFARMSPDEKNEVVERLQTLGYTVLMCGDGANDCAALKAADVGISLSEAEASVAAPFTTSTPDIGCVLEVIKEGRAALVTSFSCFKYMALYSMIQFTSVTLLYSFASSLGDFQFLYIDLFIIIPIAVTMGRTLPYPRIYPKRPTASLVSKKVLASIIGQIVITSTVQFWAYFWVRRQEWYTPPPTTLPSEGGDNKLESTNFENSVLFYISCFQYILIAAVFSIGPPYRKSMWTNGWLMFSMCLLSAFNVLVLLAPPTIFVKLLELMSFPSGARYTLLLAASINVVVCLGYEAWGTQGVSSVLGAGMRWWQRSRRRVRDGKTYKVVEGGMR
ncbi:putative cation-transporting ATPase [Psilocybe cubensis]|uniref:Cation-transporting ATPase n=2 Tax=Psilocybe cubensis TaxID=181762 RepID=A0A8H7Y4D0_PSICU|nr:putative cation-transporting ATPase [Psilocybe cubensis]KAH9485007.1 putative cation-transporting ATPase [Psilocybe cubensis]